MTINTISRIKHSFFYNSISDLPDLSFNDTDFNLDQIRREFDSLYLLFLSNKELWSTKAEIIFYMNYLCNLLIRYYDTDYVRSDSEKLRKQRSEIQQFIQKHFIDSDHPTFDGLSEFLLYTVSTNADNYTHSIAHIAELRNNLSDLNTTRSRWSYSRSLAIYAINFIQNSSLSDLIHEINTILGNQYSFVDGLNFLEHSREVLSVMGIVLFTLRFSINLMLIMKHTIQSITNRDLDTSKVLVQELEKRAFIMSSDIVWSLATLVTNYSLFFGITSLTSSIIVGSFLVFDTALLLAMWYFEFIKYAQRLQELYDQMPDSSELEHTVIQRQIDLLNDQWQAQQTYYTVNVVGSCIIAISFGIALVFTNPLGLAGLALCSMLGNALYNTAADYKKAELVRLALNRERANGLILDDEHHQKLMVQLTKEYNVNFNQFCKNLAFNVGGIAFIITAAVASWPVAVCLATSYILYQLFSTYQRHLESRQAESIEHDIYRQIPSPSPAM